MLLTKTGLSSEIVFIIIPISHLVALQSYTKSPSGIIHLVMPVDHGDNGDVGVIHDDDVVVVDHANDGVIHSPIELSGRTYSSKLGIVFVNQLLSSSVDPPPSYPEKNSPG